MGRMQFSAVPRSINLRRLNGKENAIISLHLGLLFVRNFYLKKIIDIKARNVFICSVMHQNLDDCQF